jgi:hypothetical protein
MSLSLANQARTSGRRTCSPPIQRLKHMSVVRGEKGAGDVVMRGEVVAEGKSCGRGVMSEWVEGRGLRRAWCIVVLT